MYNLFRTLILFISMSILFFALISPILLENVTLHLYDALIITFYVIASNIVIRFVSIHESKKMEEKILLQYSQMQAILNNSPLFIYLKDLDGTILLANKKLYEYFNKNVKNIVGIKAQELFINNETILDEDKIVYETKQPLVIEKQLEIANGQQVWYKIAKVPLVNKWGHPTSYVVILKDIDMEKELENRKEPFVATLTHDLKTPTVAQIKVLDLLLNDTFGKLNNEQKDMLWQIKSSCKYMYDLIFTILDTYMFENGQIKIKEDYFNIVELINVTMKELLSLSIEKNQNVNFINNLNTEIIYADKAQIKRVIVNLLSNAITYGFKETDVNIVLSETDSEIKCHIDNKACPIKQELLDDIFLKFKTAENAKFQKTQNGLGLYLSKQIISAHNGSITVSCNKDGVCVFEFTIPKTIAKIETHSS